MIVPDRQFNIEINEELTLTLNATYDHLYYYQPMDVNWLRYQDPETDTLSIAVINEPLAKWILENTDIPYTYRESITNSEHERLIKVVGRMLIGSALDFEPEEWDEEVEE